MRTRGVCCDVGAPLRPQEINEAVAVLKALADPTRLGMMVALRDQGTPICICDLTAAFDLTQPTISHHMAILKRAGLVAAEKRGLWIHYSLRSDLAPGVRKVLEAVA